MLLRNYNKHLLEARAAQGISPPPAKLLFMEKRTYRRPSNQLRQLEAKSGHCQPAKASHRVIKPLCMYQTQIAGIADA